MLNYFENVSLFLACFEKRNLVFLILQFAYFTVTCFFFWDRFTARYIVLSTFCLLANIFAYQFMSRMATPRYENDDRGNKRLVDAGLDLNIGPGGLAELVLVFLFFLSCFVYCLIQFPIFLDTRKTSF